ncbi:hypothetical protein [Nonomuraea angiospora]|uniref:hypothetical protein n=1 Tax=Nonomuraea angiospora TaxID=46172 RepID=UPI0029BAC221|nr:hypothetical protein [Nonomuraea angiospora]MDX3099726.1 hypothetical protein [Nonomuraea angiospora]
MNVVLWIVQAVLAVMFGMAGVMKSTQPKDKLAAKLPWVEAFVERFAAADRLRRPLLPSPEG